MSEKMSLPDNFGLKTFFEYIALLTPKLHFPLVIPKGIGFVWGVKRSILETEVQNVGDAACGFRVIFKAKGSVSNPLVKNSYTGEQIRLLYEMQKGDVIEVINEPNRKLIYINGQKDFAKLDRLKTTFFSLAPGKNMLGYAADGAFLFPPERIVSGQFHRKGCHPLAPSDFRQAVHPDIDILFAVNV